MRYYFLLFFPIIFLGTPILAQYNYNGVVLDGASKNGIQGVTVTVNNKNVTLTDSAGKFFFTDSNTNVNINFSSLEYLTFTKTYSSDNMITVNLFAANTLLLPVMVQAFEKNTAINYVPVAITVLTKADMERYSNTSLVQAINTVPGVKMDERSPGSYRLSIRGNLLRSPFGVRNVKVYWNGIPFTDANGNTYLNQIGFDNVGKIEIIKGPGGSLYGAGTGGVVLISGNDGVADEHSLTINSVAGSWGTTQVGVNYKNNTANSTSALSYSHQQSEGWRNHTNLRRDVANYMGSFIINKKQTISTNIFYSDLYYQTPGGLTAAQVAIDPRQSRPAAGSFPGAESQQAAIYEKTFYAGFSNKFQFNTDWSNTTSIYTGNTRFKNPGILNYQRKTEQNIGGRTVTQYHKNFLTVNFGAEYQYCYTGTGTFGNKQGVSDTIQFNDEIGATQYNMFLQTDFSLANNLVINAGISYNNYNYNFTRLNQLPVISITKTFSPILVPRISILKKINNRYSIYATVSKGYSPPTIDEIVPATGIFNAALDAEKAINYEIGTKTELIRNKLFAELSYYLFYLNNTLVTRRDLAGAPYFVNAGKTKQNGFEASVNYYPIINGKGLIQQFKFFINYTNINAKFIDYLQQNINYNNKKLTGTPPNVMVAGTDINTNSGIYFNATYSFTDKLPINDANTFYANQYNLLLGRLGYKKRLNKVLEGEIYFAFDKSFNNPYSLGNDLNATAGRYFNPSAPENYFGGLKLKFNL